MMDVLKVYMNMDVYMYMYNYVCRYVYGNVEMYANTFITNWNRMEYLLTIIIKFEHMKDLYMLIQV